MPSEDNQSSDSSSEESNEHSKKRHRRDDEVKSKKKKEKKEKKEKKSKKHKKKHKRERHESLAVNQQEYGKYGIIKDQDFFKYQREFEIYMSEIKHIPNVLSLSKREVMEHFQSYAEDFNTATMPNAKYYNLEKWEMEEYKRNKPSSSSSNSNKEYNARDDEEQRRVEIKRKREEEEARALQSALNRMGADKEKREGLRLQEALKAQLQMAYRMGNQGEVKRIEALLMPVHDKEQDEDSIPHPWA